MKLRLGKLFIGASLVGFIGVGGLLLTNHPGFAMKTTNYIFFLLLGGIVYEKLY